MQVISTFNHILKRLKRYLLFFLLLSKSSKSTSYYILIASQFRLAPFQMVKSHMQLSHYSAGQHRSRCYLDLNTFSFL